MKSQISQLQPLDVSRKLTVERSLRITNLPYSLRILCVLLRRS